MIRTDLEILGTGEREFQLREEEIAGGRALDLPTEVIERTVVMVGGSGSVDDHIHVSGHLSVMEEESAEGWTEL